MLEKIDFDSIVKQLKKRRAKRVGIQLPDGLKYKSDEITERIEKAGFEVILSGHGTYGACDVDVALLQEVDVLVHFAHTPIFTLEKVIYAPYLFNFDAELVVELEIKERRLALIATAQYAWKLEEVKRVLDERGYEVELKTGKRVTMPGQVLGCNYSVLRNSKAEAILFVGDGLFHPVGAAIYTGKKVYRFSPLSNEFEEIRYDDFMRKRMLEIARVMDVKKKGAIIVSSKLGQKRIGIAERLKRRAAKAGKLLDIIMMDEITPVKLSNFPYGYYVNTACPRISYDDAKLYAVPILTPQEFEIVIGLRKWEDYEMDEVR
jgi:2-(3-amino-3-carboxypropyl)histidine synthase